MKVIKFDRRHGLYKRGFTHGWRFNSWQLEAYNIEQGLRERGFVIGQDWDYFWAMKPARITKKRPYYIGVRDEQMVTFVTLLL